MINHQSSMPWEEARCNVTPAAVDADDSENTDNLTARVTEQDSLAAPGATQLDELDLPQRAELSSQDALTPADLPANVDCVGVFQFPVENVNEALVQWLSAKVENARRTRKESRVGVFVIGVEEERGMMGDRCRRDCWNRRFERSASKKRRRKHRQKAGESQEKLSLTKFFDWRSPVENTGNSEE
ncbi:unnamed protein product [Notodromas monacha]|uniref:Uncharacterized protein n=1 Tax=Notodromas monacha TaxID=399045 RepID=A0A7R9BE55_9CRUS|nr:unnamed protein product [Notodromas monacha]CAG0913721.1 unnamed protein product [Notodromas monacha]